MEPPNDSVGESGINRRRLLTTVAGAAGLMAFTGPSAATDAREINFCGCSQVCVTGDGPIKVVVGYRKRGNWEFEETIRQTDFCYTIEDAINDFDDISRGDEPKIIAVRETDADDPDSFESFGNPTQCAQKALDEYKNGGKDLGGPNNLDIDNYANDVNPDPDVRQLEFGTFGTPPVDVIRGRCGKP